MRRYNVQCIPIQQRSARMGTLLNSWVGLTALVMGVCFLVGLGNLGAEEATWLDGSLIVRFDKQAATEMKQVADWSSTPERRWAGPTIWTNRLQDWVVRDGALFCEPKNNLPCRTAHLLTHELSDQPGVFQLEVVVRLASRSAQAGFAGFLIGAGEGRLDHRGAAMIHHSPGKGGGILAVVETADEGGLSFRNMSAPETKIDFPMLDGQETLAKNPIRLDYHRMMLNLEGIPRNDGLYDLRLSVWAQHSGELLGAQELQGVPASHLLGNVALVAHSQGQEVFHVFESFRVAGERLAHHPERTFGPVAGTLYSLSDEVLKLSAQFMHLGEAIKQKQHRLSAQLERRSEDGEWLPISRSIAISPPDYYVLFRVEDWDASRTWETRVTFEDANGISYAYETTVQRDPTHKETVSIAGFTGMGVMGRVAHARGPKADENQVIVGRWTPANVWMPFAEAVHGVSQQDVDLLFFTGDQIYEGKPSPKDPSRTPYDDYLYKWLLWHWSFRELTNHLPAVVQPDDHDVYHGNLWGWGGRLCMTGNISSGGYQCSPYFVNMVHRTQTGHNPDPYDPAPVLNGISNYYNGFTYGNIGFAVLEDRKFKTPSSVQEPEKQVQLGETQLRFLREWGEDWTDQKFKVVVSQTIYAAMHVSFNGKLARDADTNGFPKVGRDRSVRLFQRCGAFVLSGDQHLSTFARLGIDRPSDAVYQFCVPALANIFWRWFYPTEMGTDREPDTPGHLGEFTDAWGNYFRMIAVANPERPDLLGQKLRQRSVLPAEEAVSGLGDAQRTCLGDGYGVVRFDKTRQEITVECWPHNADVSTDQPFPGWPVTLRLEDLDGRTPVGWLPDLNIQGIADAVVQLLNQDTGEVVKVTRARDGFYRPGVFTLDARYTLRVGEPGQTDGWWEAHDLVPQIQPDTETLDVMLTIR